MGPLPLWNIKKHNFPEGQGPQLDGAEKPEISQLYSIFTMELNISDQRLEFVDINLRYEQMKWIIMTTKL